MLINKDLIFSVHEFNELIAQYLNRIEEITVEGEISQLNISQGKWLFVTLKDDQASVSVFAPVFKISNANTLEEGMKIKVIGQPSLHRRSGRFSLNADRIIPSGEGDLLRAYQILKEKLKKQGLFDEQRKRKIKIFPQKVALLTAEGSRAYTDFIKVCNERIKGIKIDFYPVQVQGVNSVDSILKTFEYLNNLEKQSYDVIVLTRGGGSLEDLMTFNDEKVAKAVFASQFPVVSAIGHEDDIALTDLCADLRASTPSNAAQLIFFDQEEIKAKIDNMFLSMYTIVQSNIKKHNKNLSMQVRYLQLGISQIIDNMEEVIYSLRKYFIVYENSIQTRYEEIKNITEKLYNQIKIIYQVNKDQLQTLLRLLQSNSYENILKKGFSITYSADNEIIKDAKQVKNGEIITTKLLNTSLNSKIIKLNKE